MAAENSSTHRVREKRWRVTPNEVLSWIRLPSLAERAACPLDGLVKTFLMHVITRRRLNEFAEVHPDAQSSLEHWYRVMKTHRFANFAQLRELFLNADQVGNKTVFNIGGNKYRLIAALHYNRARVYIRAILTHRDYDKGTWKKP